MPPSLPASFLLSLVTELKTPQVIGITMSGSYSRGQGTDFSDVDLQVYVTEKPAGLIGKLETRLREGYLVSIHYGNLEAERAKLTEPWTAIWAVPGLRQSAILHDPENLIAKLKQDAILFKWEPLQLRADQFASAELATSAEEVYKILGGLATQDESKVAYAITGLMMDMAEVVSVQRGLMIETENRYFDLVQESAGEDSEWTRLFRLALGAEHGPEHLPTYRTRGLASLGLYRETARLMDEIILNEHSEVIRVALEKIRETT